MTTARTADTQEYLRKVLSRNRRLTNLILRMDANRDSLGDSCRLCGTRVWVGPNGVRIPGHTPTCPVGRLRDKEGGKE